MTNNSRKRVARGWFCFGEANYHTVLVDRGFFGTFHEAPACSSAVFLAQEVIILGPSSDRTENT